jgi:predicted tellurium resistance membrane protein TerC
MESIRVLLEGVASVFRGMASTPLIVLASIVVAVLTLVLLNELIKREASSEAGQER